MHDIALGFKDQDDDEEDLVAFSKAVGGYHADQWVEVGFYRKGEFAGFGPAFQKVVGMVILHGNKIHFNLTGVDVGRALSGDPAKFVGRYTAWELQQIVSRSELFDATIFYKDGKVTDSFELSSLGITRPA